MLIARLDRNVILVRLKSNINFLSFEFKFWLSCRVQLLCEPPLDQLNSSVDQQSFKPETLTRSSTASPSGQHEQSETTRAVAGLSLPGGQDKVVLEPRVSPEHTSKYLDTVTVFAKT